MKSNKKFTKLVSGIVITTTIIGSGAMAFADTTVRENSRFVDGKRIERRADRDNPIIRKVVKKEVLAEKFIGIVKQYDSENLEFWNNAIEKRTEAREDLVNGLKDNDKLEEAKIYFEDLKARVANGDISREEAKNELTQKRAENKDARREKIDELKVEKAEEIDKLKEYKKSMAKAKLELVKAVRQDDAEQIKVVLQDMKVLVESL